MSVTLRYTRSTSSAPPSASSATDSPSAPSRSTHSPLRRRASTPRCSARAATPARSARATRACDRDETCPRDATTRCHRARPRARVRREHAARPVADEPRQFNDPLRAELVVRERAPRHRVHDAVDPLVLRLRALLPREVLGVADLARLARLLCRRRRACHRGRAISSGSADVANAHGARAHRKPSVRAFSTYSDDARRERSVLALTAHSGLAREAGSTLGSRIDWATLMHRDTQRPDGAPPPTCASVARAVRTGTGRWTTYPRPHGARLLRPRGSASTSFASTAGASSSTGRRDLHRARGAAVDRGSPPSWSTTTCPWVRCEGREVEAVVLEHLSERSPSLADVRPTPLTLTRYMYRDGGARLHLCARPSGRASPRRSTPI